MIGVILIPTWRGVAFDQSSDNLGSGLGTQFVSFLIFTLRGKVEKWILTSSFDWGRLTAVEIRFADKTLERLYTDPRFDARFEPGVGKAFRKRIQFIRAAPDERDFYKMRSLRFEKLKGDRSHQHSMRLNDQWRLVLELQGEVPNKVVVVVSIEDYH